MFSGFETMMRIRMLVDDLMGGFGPSREAAMYELISIGPSAARYITPFAFMGHDVVFKRHVARILGEVGDGWSIAALQWLLWDRDPRVRRKAADALHRMSQRIAAGDLRPNLLLKAHLAVALPMLRAQARRSHTPHAFEGAAEEIREVMRPQPAPAPDDKAALPIPATPARTNKDLPRPSSKRGAGEKRR